MIAEKPSTGWAGNGNATPFWVLGMKAPAGGPAANVSKGRTARPTRLGSPGDRPDAPVPCAGPAAPTWLSAPIVADSVSSTAARVMNDRRGGVGRN